MFNKIINYTKSLGAFGAGMLIGVIYGAIVSTITCAIMLGVP
jgi:hypothetical protein